LFFFGFSEDGLLRFHYSEEWTGDWYYSLFLGLLENKYFIRVD